jgi:hypothetical protein
MGNAFSLDTGGTHPLQIRCTLHTLPPLIRHTHMGAWGITRVLDDLEYLVL